MSNKSEDMAEKKKKSKYRTDASEVPPFFQVKFVLKRGVGLYTGAESDR